MQKLGQHFLKNAAILQKVVDALALADGDRVIEIGPGHGELTTPLALAARSKHCEIFCIEKDHALISGLEAFAGQENIVAAEHAGGGDAHADRINIVEGDALKLLPEVVKGASHYKIAGNIPYYITGKLLRVISELEYKPERVALLIQKEVAERICAVAPDMNRLAASVQFWADAEIIAHVSKMDFSPPPEVDSAVIILRTKTPALSVDSALYYRAVRGIFAQPRKTLLNNVSVAAGDGIAKGDIAARFEKIGIDPAARPQDLSIEQIIAIAQMNLKKL